MNQPEILDSDIRAMQQWLRAAWRQLSDPSLTTFSRRELRNQMKQCSADLRERLQRVAEQPSGPLQQPPAADSRPALRIMSW
jgi:cellulose synthase/poly-beta-1,6-N-acetylglucosamine synthase-like glycosyltransferase